MDNRPDRPSWLRERCPDWCVTEHREDDAPEDRHHDGTATYVPVILGVRTAEEPSYRPAITDMLVVRSRRCGESEEWLFVGEPDRHRQHLNVAPESALRLAHAIVDAAGSG